MVPYVCAQCQTKWYPGFFGNKVCPQCPSSGLVRRVLRFVRNWALLFAAVFFLIGGASYDRLKTPDQLKLFAYRFVSFPNFFLIGPADYLNSLSDPGVLPGYYSFQRPMHGYASPLTDAALSTARPTVAIPPERPFHLIEVRRFGSRDWLGGSAYMGDRPVEFWVPLQGPSQATVSPYDYDRARAAQRSAFFAALQRQVPLQRVRGEGAAVEYTRQHPDQTRLTETLDDSSFAYYPKSEAGTVRSLRDYFLSPHGLGMTILQLDATFRRPPPESPSTPPEKSNG